MTLSKRKNKSLMILVVVAFLSVIFIVVVFNPFSKSRLDIAAGYLKNYFNEAIGLVYESEDKGIQNIGGFIYSHNQIFWVYSDNLLVLWALESYEPQISSAINETIQSYRVPQSQFFEVLFGETIPEDFSTAVKLVLEQNPDWVVMAEFHNSSIRLLWEQYGDTLIYQSLNLHLRGNRIGAEHYFNQAHQMWDGRGIYDLFTQENGIYANYKLALILYASRVLNITIEDYDQIEEKLWSMQQSNGGITSLADLDGNPVGSANAETTAMALLPYNDDLISRMQTLSGNQ